MSKSITIELINTKINEELEIAKVINPQMAFGMLRIREILNDIVEEDNE